ncbi:hypothetical protein ACFVUY_41815 [Kitasatospora sp. NPDC058063]|uniref:hypothetical protein n=1 Tax=unclassified Kitasatospora TaxID=2633591 RepID=UPI0036D79C0B
MSSSFISDPSELDEELEVALGRRAPFSQVGDWMLLSGADSDARTLYWGMVAHVNVSRDDNEVWPGLTSLARILQLKKPDGVSKYMLQLEVLGAVEVIRSTSGLVSRNRYIVHQTPPRGYRGPQSMAAWYGMNRAPKDETKDQREQREAEFDAWLNAVRTALKVHCDKVAAQRAAARKAKLPVPPVENFRMPELANFRTPAPGGTARPAVMPESPEIPVPPRRGVEQDEGEKDETDAPPARAGGDARRASTGSSAHAMRSGCAAFDKTGSSAKSRNGGVRMTRDQAAKVRTVVASFPVELTTLPAKPLPARIPANPLGNLIREQLKHRTPEQLAERIQRRWVSRGYLAKLVGLDPMEAARTGVGLAVELVKASPDCPDLSCEDGVIIGSGAPCRACEMRSADRRTGGGAGVPQQVGGLGEGPVKVKWWCATDGCGYNSYGTGPADGLCPDCRTEQELGPIDPVELAEAARAFAAAGFRPDAAL